MGYTQYELYGTPYMGHLVRLVEILTKIRDTTSWPEKLLGHLKKSERTLEVILLNITRINLKNKGHLRVRAPKNQTAQ